MSHRKELVIPLERMNPSDVVPETHVAHIHRQIVVQSIGIFMSRPYHTVIWIPTQDIPNVEARIHQSDKGVLLNYYNFVDIRQSIKFR